MEKAFVCSGERMDRQKDFRILESYFHTINRTFGTIDDIDKRYKALEIALETLTECHRVICKEFCGTKRHRGCEWVSKELDKIKEILDGS